MIRSCFNISEIWRFCANITLFSIDCIYLPSSKYNLWRFESAGTSCMSSNFQFYNCWRRNASTQRNTRIIRKFKCLSFHIYYNLKPWLYLMLTSVYLRVNFTCFTHYATMFEIKLKQYDSKLQNNWGNECTWMGNIDKFRASCCSPSLQLPVTATLSRYKRRNR